MQTKLLFFTTLGAALAAAPAGCGSLDGHTGTPATLATVQGALTNPASLDVGGNVRVAVVWLDGDGGLSVSEDLPVQPVFPSSFTVQLDGPPPAAALVSDPDAPVQVAYGVVVAYEDLNGDGKLDLVPADAGAFIDKVVGANPNLNLIYIAGTIPSDIPPTNGTPVDGYQLYEAGDCAPSQALPDGGFDADAAVYAPDGGACTGPTWLPISTPYDLTVSSNPQVSEIMCQGYGSSGSSAAGSGTSWSVSAEGPPPGGYPPAGAPGLTCQGSTGYEYEQCQTVQTTLCTSMQECSEIIVELGSASPPPQWPCP